jgi:tRNA(Ile2) C34 agmatinyltransferase TiaS
MILIGLDDTDSLHSRGTNQLAKGLIRTVLSDFRCRRIVRHQLLIDDRIPFTSKNGSASIWLEPADVSLDDLFRLVADAVERDFIDGSDPGLCVARDVPPSLCEFGRLCQRSVVTIDHAFQLAKEAGVRLAGLGGTNGGVIGALAAVGLAATDDGGRVVQMHGVADDVSGIHSIEQLQEWGVLVVERTTGQTVTKGDVDVGKKLRPNLHKGRIVLFAQRLMPESTENWTALKLI